MARSILKEISVNELQGMRDTGMSNQEIADALGINAQTVRNYIGTIPEEWYERWGRPKCGIRGKAKAKPAPAPEPEEENAGLVVQNKKIDLDGLFAQYCVDCKRGEIMITIDGTMMLIKRENLDDFINELKALRRNLDKLTVQNEMW